MANASGANQWVDAEGNPKETGKAGNQFTTGKRSSHDPATKDKMRAEKAATKMEEVIDDPNATIDQKIAASKVLMPYGKASLQSIMQTIEEKPIDESETAAQLAHIIASNPAILAPLVQADPGVRAALQAILTGQPAPVDRGESATNAAQQGVNAA